MTLSLVITNAGRAAITNAQSSGTNVLTITKVGVTASVFTPLATQTALPGEIKKLDATAGGAIAAGSIHISATDASSDVYDLHGFGLYLTDGTLFALYSQVATIQSKAAGAQALLAGDIVFTDLGAVTVTVGSTAFLNPPATTEIQGVVELATSAETIAKTDTSRAVAPKGLWDAFTNWIATATAGMWTAANDGAGSGLDADLLDGQHAAYFLPAASYTAADIMTKMQGVDGAGSGLDADLLDGQHAAYFLPAASYTAADIMTKMQGVDGAGSGLDADLLDGQHAAYFLPAASYTAADALTKIKTVDGASSGLDADLLDGQEGAYYTAITARLGYTPLNTTAYTASDVLAKMVTVDGAGSGLDADLLDGQQGAYYLPAGSYTASDLLSKLTGVDGAGSGLDADLLDGQQGAYYLPAGSYTASDILSKLTGVDGSGSGLDADLLDGNHASAFALYTLTNSVLPGTTNTNGTYFKIGNLIIQCGMKSTIAVDSTVTVTYPVAMTNAPFFFIAGSRVSSFDSGADSFGQIIGTPGTASMTVANQRVNNSAVIDVPWLIMAWA